MRFAKVWEAWATNDLVRPYRAWKNRGAFSEGAALGCYS